MASHFEVLKKEVEKGLLGKTQGIPICLPHQERFLSIRKNIYTLIGGDAGCGKTSYIDNVYVLEPYEWLLANPKSETKAEWVYRCMERSISHKLAKWACWLLFKYHGVLITPGKLLGWENTKLTTTEKDLFDGTQEFFQTMQDSKIITLIGGQENPRGIFLQLEKYALARGKEEELSEYEKSYYPNNPNLIIIPVIDPIGKCKLETVDGKKNRKSTTEKMSEYLSICRDRFGMSPVVISHLNRTTKAEVYNKQSDPEPTQESFKETGTLFDDCDVSLALFDPYKFKLFDHAGYDIKGFINTETFANTFRSLKLLKSSYSSDNIRWPLAFNGAVGGWKDLKRAKDMTPEDYAKVRNLEWFKN